MDSEFDRLLTRQIAFISTEEDFDRLDEADINYPEDEPEPEMCHDHGELLPCFACADECAAETAGEFPEYPEPEIEEPIPGVTLNGGPVFEDDF